ncbi:MAG: hypothetical protein LUB63_04365 [Oscillospiraceae bacterium]|nr:hypothetical protein [Oscillospiraceae bacterium]
MFLRKSTAADYDRQLARVCREKELYDKRLEIRKVKRSMRSWRWPTTTKIIMTFLLLNCTAVEVYSMVVMYQLQNLDALYSLITAVITESISFAVYAAKSYNETKQEELIKLEWDRMDAALCEAEGAAEDIGEKGLNSEEAMG